MTLMLSLKENSHNDSGMKNEAVKSLATSHKICDTAPALSQPRSDRGKTLVSMLFGKDKMMPITHLMMQ